MNDNIGKTQASPDASEQTSEPHGRDNTHHCSSLPQLSKALKQLREGTVNASSKLRLPNLFEKMWISRFSKSSSSPSNQHPCFSQSAANITASRMAAGNLGHFAKHHPREMERENDGTPEAVDELDTGKCVLDEDDNVLGLPNIHHSSLPPQDDVALAIKMAKIVTYKIKKDQIAGIYSGNGNNRSVSVSDPKPQFGKVSVVPADNLSLIDNYFTEREKRYKGNNIPGVYQFPKPKDFMDCNSQGVNWKAKCSINSFENGKKVGRLHRSPFPCTDAMHREKTSVTKTKAAVLKPGQVDVTKVWSRQTSDFDTPLVMARKDIPVKSTGSRPTAALN